jgi:hypothetical protein
MATSPNFNWPEPDNTDLVKNGALAIRTAVDAIDTSLVDLKGGTTGQVLAKASGTDMDFSWVAQDDSNAIQNAIVDAKGDIIAATANDTPARLAVGANNTVLTADSTTATGLKWAAPSGGLTLISQVSFSDVASQIFDSVFSSTYRSYKIVINNIFAATGSDDLELQFRYGSTTQTSDYYGGFASVSYLGAQLLNGQNATAQLVLMANCGSSSDENSAEFTVTKVGNASEKASLFGMGWDWPLTGFYSFGGGQFTGRTYTGFLLKSNSSNISGRVSIYGYGN